MSKLTVSAFFTKRIRIAVMALASTLYLAGCSGPAVKKAPIFFPPPPNPPRIQFLKGIADSKDIEEVKGGFTLFMTGQQEADAIKTIGKPYGVTAYKGKIYVSDLGASSIVIIDPARKDVSYLKGNYGLGKLKKPSNVAFDAEDNMYVSDALRKDVVVFSPAGEFLRAIGKETNMKPADIAVDGDDLYVLDIANNEIKIFDRKEGTLARSFGKATEQAEGLAVPTNFTLDDKGFLYATNIGTGKIIKMDRDGHILMSFGKLGDIVGEFARPKGITVDPKGRIFVVDGGHQNVQIFNETGRILAFFGDPGLTSGSLNLPVGIAVTRDNLDYFQKMAAPGFILEEAIIVTNQFGNEKLSIYGLGQMEGYKEPTPEELQKKGTTAPKPEPEKEKEKEKGKEQEKK
jgi:sugar lactone lactonase YvrE